MRSSCVPIGCEASACRTLEEARTADAGEQRAAHEKERLCSREFTQHLDRFLRLRLEQLHDLIQALGAALQIGRADTAVELLVRRAQYGREPGQFGDRSLGSLRELFKQKLRQRSRKLGLRVAVIGHAVSSDGPLRKVHAVAGRSALARRNLGASDPSGGTCAVQSASLS
jgi:hypothetical protein